ncbi:peptide chain release factor N(5)-glutamine methyltransferase [Lachnobacterium bovis]|uniref:Release factor glutamine methyltransferase n=1 Tax=Lachnobacterium bovis DSM 14045 TaxID=1122142 RepID=A0A1H3HKC5_9FIRM|nr:peptide chain release factor N(5)-glutamine methyltransferase [Lachnobacterium bovis]SDY16006.1 release factor glutamine methyltransferase [Lachnobacterium bovis DSM 14045]
MTYKEVLDNGTERLLDVGIVDAKNDAWLLLEMVCKIDRNYYYMHMQDEVLAEHIREYDLVIGKRAERVPLQYITGEQEFYGLNFRVNSSVLVPRQDTETLVEEVLKRIEPNMSILDMCTGSGCILISVLKNSIGVSGLGIDISKNAINLAKENAKINNVVAEFETSDLFENVKDKYDIIVSNPPYIKTEEIQNLMPEVAMFEPIGALDGKEDGLYFYRKIVRHSKEFLNHKGYLILEIGYDQGKSLDLMMNQADFKNVQVIKDLAGNDRVVVGQLE